MLPDWQRDFCAALTEQTQTPTDMAALTVLSAAGADLARKGRVQVRPGWQEPLNLFTAVALLPGERKSTVIDHCLGTVHDFERAELDRLRPLIAEEQTYHRQLEKRLDHLEKQAAKAEGDELDALRRETADVAGELDLHHAPLPPQLICEDVTPEALAKFLADQDGRILIGSAEATCLEILKGRYSEGVSLEVYLKGHAGDNLRENRVGRATVAIERPTLSLALAVQPDAIHGLAAEATLKARGFLARILYAVPESSVGHRRIAAPPIPQAVADAYRKHLIALWSIPARTDDAGQPAPHLLEMSAEAEGVMREFETRLEPQLGPDGELSALAGWANKLAGACGRIAATLHVAAAIGAGQDWRGAR